MRRQMPQKDPRIDAYIAKAPPDMLAALKKNGDALAAWRKFPPSHQREYIEWVTDAKTEATRLRRLERAVAWIAEGKGRNWKYAR